MVNACPKCNDPVTFGGGITMTYLGRPFASAVGVKYPFLVFLKKIKKNSIFFFCHQFKIGYMNRKLYFLFIIIYLFLPPSIPCCFDSRWMIRWRHFCCQIFLFTSWCCVDKLLTNDTNKNVDKQQSFVKEKQFFDFNFDFKWFFSKVKFEIYY